MVRGGCGGSQSLRIVLKGVKIPRIAGSIAARVERHVNTSSPLVARRSPALRRRPSTLHEPHAARQLSAKAAFAAFAAAAAAAVDSTAIAASTA
jgi:hypothetical protein